ncbi:MAG: KPN_02809 family neutral zinc metallopeptidase [Paracoccaceae bacterium]
MQWRGRRGSNNIEDRRRTGGGARAGGIGGAGVIVVLLLGWFFGVDVSGLLNDPGAQQGGPSQELSAADEEAGQFVSVVLASTEQVWDGIFREQLDRTYQPPTLQLFSGSTSSACGGASGATGPFYCPGDRKAYLDTSFFVTLERRLGAAGDFAAAYVVAHEIAHGVQDQLGVLGQANQVRAQVSQEESNLISVRIELQADCLSGVYANHARDMLDLNREDFLEALNAAQQIGDDTLQANAGQRPMPHTFTHGTSEQRARWFLTGLQSGEVAACDTFGTNEL